MRVIFFDTRTGFDNMLTTLAGLDITEIKAVILSADGGRYTPAQIAEAAALAPESYDAVVIGHQMGDGEAIAKVLHLALLQNTVVVVNAYNPQQAAAAHNYPDGVTRFCTRIGSTRPVAAHLAEIAAGN